MDKNKVRLLIREYGELMTKLGRIAATKPFDHDADEATGVKMVEVRTALEDEIFTQHHDGRNPHPDPQ